MSEHKWGDEIRVGDVVEVFGTRTITNITPYGPSNIDFIDDRWRVMHSGDFRMTLDPDAGWAKGENGAWRNSHRRRPGACPGDRDDPAEEGVLTVGNQSTEKGYLDRCPHDYAPCPFCMPMSDKTENDVTYIGPEARCWECGRRSTIILASGPAVCNECFPPEQSVVLTTEKSHRLSQEGQVVDSGN